VFEVASSVQNPLSNPSYHHDANQAFLLGVVDPSIALLNPPVAPRLPAYATGPQRAPNLSPQLEAMVFALRDAEVLVLGGVQPGWITGRHPMY
jgi:hypothetical protein